jgi:hypothetical protein
VSSQPLPVAVADHADAGGAMSAPQSMINEIRDDQRYHARNDILTNGRF